MLIANRLKSDRDVNRFEDYNFQRSLQYEETFLTLTNRQSIDYVNLGDFMRLVFEEFKKTYALKVVPSTLVT
jgi:folate-dependent phosphoribosylglycinamide formyltransferase PurN